jgi:hypothetical protein
MTSYGYGLGGYGAGTYGGQPIILLPLSYYLGLLTSEYQGSTNYLSWVQALLQPLDDASNCLSLMTLAFDLDQAVGVQLDVLGVIIGQSRRVNFQPRNGVSPVLDDATYRVLLKARIAQNQWDGTVDGLQGVWESLFPGGRLSINDNQNMSATVILSGAFSSITQDLITNGLIIPRPEGVQYTFTFAALPLFGFDRTDAFVSGFDAGKWS